jgi:hypothetical protein
VGRAARRPVAPEKVDDPVDRNDHVRVQDQDREEGALLRRPEVCGPAILGDLEGPEDPKGHHGHMLATSHGAEKCRNAPSTR